MAVFTATITPTVDTSAYVDNDCVGGVIEIVGAPPAGVIESLIISDKGDQGNGMELFFFESEPAGVADNAAFTTMVDADLQKLIGYLAEDTWEDMTDGQFAPHVNISLAYQTIGGSLWMMIRVEDASPPTYTATDDLQIKLSIVY